MFLAINNIFTADLHSILENHIIQYKPGKKNNKCLFLSSRKINQANNAHLKPLNPANIKQSQEFVYH